MYDANEIDIETDNENKNNEGIMILNSKKYPLYSREMFSLLKKKVYFSVAIIENAICEYLDRDTYNPRLFIMSTFHG